MLATIGGKLPMIAVNGWKGILLNPRGFPLPRGPAFFPGKQKLPRGFPNPRGLLLLSKRFERDLRGYLKQ